MPLHASFILTMSFVAAADMADAAHGGDWVKMKPPKVVMAAKRPDFRW
jgi:hypothetical protein